MQGPFPERTDMPTRSENDREKIIGPYMACSKEYGIDVRSHNACKRNTLGIQPSVHASTGGLQNTIGISSRYER